MQTSRIERAGAALAPKPPQLPEDGDGAPGVSRATRRASNFPVEAAISSTAASNAAPLARDGVRYPETLRTYCRAASLTSSSPARRSGSLSFLVLRHIGHLSKGWQTCGPGVRCWPEGQRHITLRPGIRTIGQAARAGG